MSERIIEKIEFERTINIDAGSCLATIRIPENWGTIYKYDTKIKPESLSKIISLILKVVRQLNEQVNFHNKNLKSQYYIATTPNLDFVLSSFPSGYINVWAKNEDILLQVQKILVQFQAPTKQSVFILTAGFEGINLSLAGQINEPLIYENYATDVATQIKNAINWASSEKPFGRILIMSGSPGTGKSYAIRGLITEAENIQWVIVPPDMVDHLSKPNFVNILLAERFEPKQSIGLIVEDADLLITKRNGINDNAVSEVLNFGDGVLADLANIKLVLTTNQNRQNIDNAITRRGRLYDFIDFQFLSKDQASQVYKRLSGEHKDYTESQALCEVYGDAFGTKIGLPKNDIKIGQYL